MMESSEEGNSDLMRSLHPEVESCDDVTILPKNKKTQHGGLVDVSSVKMRVSSEHTEYNVTETPLESAGDMLDLHKHDKEVRYLHQTQNGSLEVCSHKKETESVSAVSVPPSPADKQAHFGESTTIVLNNKDDAATTRSAGESTGSHMETELVTFHNKGEAYTANDVSAQLPTAVEQTGSHDKTNMVTLHKKEKTDSACELLAQLPSAVEQTNSLQESATAVPHNNTKAGCGNDVSAPLSSPVEPVDDEVNYSPEELGIAVRPKETEVPKEKPDIKCSRDPPAYCWILNTKTGKRVVKFWDVIMACKTCFAFCVYKEKNTLSHHTGILGLVDNVPKFTVDFRANSKPKAAFSVLLPVESVVQIWEPPHSDTIEQSRPFLEIDIKSQDNRELCLQKVINMIEEWCYNKPEHYSLLNQNCRHFAMKCIDIAAKYIAEKSWLLNNEGHDETDDGRSMLLTIMKKDDMYSCVLRKVFPHL